jgi:hypothetical protein
VALLSWQDHWEIISQTRMHLARASYCLIYDGATLHRYRAMDLARRRLHGEGVLLIVER